MSDDEAVVSPENSVQSQLSADGSPPQVDLNALMEKALGPDESVARDAVDAISRLRTTVAMPRLDQIMYESPSGVVFARAFEGLASLPEFDFDSYVNALIGDHYRWSAGPRAQAAEFLSKSDPARAHAILVPMLTTSASDDVSYVASVLTQPQFQSIGFADQTQAECYWEAFLSHIDDAENIATAITDKGLQPKSSASTETTESIPVTPAEFKLRALLAVLGRFDWFNREYLNESEMRRAIHAMEEEVRLGGIVLTRLGEWGSDQRLIELAAGVLCGLFSGPKAAGRNLERMGASEADLSLLNKLRAEIGGAPAIQPLLEQLSTEIKKPLDDIRDTATKDWKDVIKASKQAFRTSLVMSIVVFVIGLAITFAALYELFHDGSTSSTLGEGISLAGGVGTMLAAFYAGPVRDIRRTVQDRGAAHVAFATYIHRLQFASTFYSGMYTQGRMTPELLKELGLDSAASQAVQVLRLTDAKDSESPDASTRVKADPEHGSIN